MKKEFWITILVIGIIILGIICAVLFEQMKKATHSATSNTEMKNEITNIEQNDNSNNEINEEDELQNSIMQNEIVENNIQEEQTNTTQEKPKTEEDKAIQIVKQDYNTTSNVEFSIEGTDANGNKIVTIRDPQTTQALAFYFVNITNGTFTKKEIN